MGFDEDRKRLLERYPEPPPVGERVLVSKEVQAQRFAHVQSFVDKHMQRAGETDAEWQKRRQDQADEMHRRLDKEEQKH